MDIYTNQQLTALVPNFPMPVHGSSPVSGHTCGTTTGVTVSRMADVRLDAVRIKGVFWGSLAWSPPIS